MISVSIYTLFNITFVGENSIMKLQHLFFSFSALFLIACGGSESTSNNENSTSLSDYSAGEEVYNKTCVVCHQAEGEGLAGAFPPLAGSDYLLDDKFRAVEQVLNGLSGEIIVNGVEYNSIMPAQEVTDQEATDVINYVLNSWGNDGGEVTLEDVQEAKHPD
jgi:nitrite reductase (NO-forming)